MTDSSICVPACRGICRSKCGSIFRSICGSLSRSICRSMCVPACRKRIYAPKHWKRGLMCHMLSMLSSRTLLSCCPQTKCTKASSGLSIDASQSNAAVLLPQTKCTKASIAISIDASQLNAAVLLPQTKCT